MITFPKQQLKLGCSVSLMFVVVLSSLIILAIVMIDQLSLSSSLSSSSLSIPIHHVRNNNVINRTNGTSNKIHIRNIEFHNQHQEIRQKKQERRRYMLDNDSRNNIYIEPTKLRLRLQFSLFSPVSTVSSVTNDGDDNSNNNNNNYTNSHNDLIEPAVMNAFTRLLCSETDILFLTPTSTSTSSSSSSSLNVDPTSNDTSKATVPPTPYHTIYVNNVAHTDICRIKWNRSSEDIDDSTSTILANTSSDSFDIDRHHSSTLGKDTNMTHENDLTTKVAVRSSSSSSSTMYMPVNDNVLTSTYASKLSKVLYQPMIQLRPHTKTKLVENNNSNSTSNDTTMMVVTNSTNVTINWTTWMISFPMIYIGELFVTEANASYDSGNKQQSSSSSSSTNRLIDHSYLLKEESARLMQGIIQMVVNLKLIDGTFDRLVQEELNLEGINNTTVYSSAVQIEWDTFYNLYNNQFYASPTKATSTTTTPEFIVHPWHGMRIWGIVLYSFTIAVFLLLHCLSLRRRKKIINSLLSTTPNVVKGSIGKQIYNEHLLLDKKQTTIKLVDVIIPSSSTSSSQHELQTIDDDDNDDDDNDNDNDECNRRRTRSVPMDDNDIDPDANGTWLLSYDSIERMLRNSSHSIYMDETMMTTKGTSSRIDVVGNDGCTTTTAVVTANRRTDIQDVIVDNDINNTNNNGKESEEVKQQEQQQTSAEVEDGNISSTPVAIKHI